MMKMANGQWAQGKYEVGRALDSVNPDELGAQVIQLEQGLE